MRRSIFRNKKKLHLALTAFLMIFIFIQSALPADLSGRESGLLVTLVRMFYQGDPDRISFIIRKCAHFTEYLFLGASLVPVIKDNRPMPGPALCMCAWLAGTAYAVFDEIHQYFVPGRSLEIRDMMIDSCGVACGIIITYIISKYSGSKMAFKKN